MNNSNWTDTVSLLLLQNSTEDEVIVSSVMAAHIFLFLWNMFKTWGLCLSAPFASQPNNAV